jgi:hypothetical protein
MTNEDKIIYSISVGDLQTVALEELHRKLAAEEIKRVEDKAGDYIDWFEAICSVISDFDNLQ